jgi:ribosomal protein S30
MQQRGHWQRSEGRRDRPARYYVGCWLRSIPPKLRAKHSRCTTPRMRELRRLMRLLDEEQRRVLELVK